MTIRPILRLAAALAALPPSAAAAQTVYEIPRDLRYLGFPGDPAEYVRLVIAGERNPRMMLEMGCPSDGGWAGAAFDLLEAEAKTDTVARDKLWQALFWAKRCPADAPRFERLRIDDLRRNYEEGRDVGVAWGWRESTDPEVHALIREIARDGDVSPPSRYLAAQVMIAHRMQDGTSRLEAERLVVLDLASAPSTAYASGRNADPVDENVWEGETVGRLVAEYGDAFRCEYERIVKEHRPPPEPVKLPPDVKRKKIGRALTREEAERLGVTLPPPPPPGPDFQPPPPKPKPCPGAGER